MNCTAEIVPYWTIAIWSHFVTSSDWQKWADNAIAAQDVPDPWLIELSLAQTEQEALGALEMSGYQLKVWESDELRNSGLGFIWRKHAASSSTLGECLLEAAAYAERFDTTIDSDLIYDLLARMRAGPKT